MSIVSQATPLFSIRSEKGRRSKMEDSHDIRVNFMELPLDPTQMEDVLPEHLPTVLTSRTRSTSVGGELLSGQRSVLSGDMSSLAVPGGSTRHKFHLFSVFDGHGGFRAAEHCANKLAQNLKLTLMRTLKKYALPIKEVVRHKTVPTHVLLAEAINLADIAGSDFEETDAEASPQENSNPSTPFSMAEVGQADCPEGAGLFSTMSINVQDRSEFVNEQRQIQTLVSRRLHELDIGLDGLTAFQLSACFNDAFVLTDNQFDCEGGAEESGTTALTAMISSQLLCFANCGDCRGVLYRDGHALQVTREHSPSCADEQKRIELLGGRMIVTRYDDKPRVMGVLNMTRAIGDFGLKPFIIPIPEVTILRRSPCDEFIVLASDGLWNAVDNQVACELVLKCFARVESRGMSRHNASRVATNLLIRKALDNGSPDNITVIVIDLRQHH